jgi:hypothetical protein
MSTDETPIIGLHDLAQQVGYDYARQLIHGLHKAAEARKVLEEQEFINAGRLDRAVERFYDEECDGRIEGFIPGGAYVYWWLRSKEMGGEVGDFWRSEEDAAWFFKKNPGCRQRNVMARARSGYNGVIFEGTKYGDVRSEAADPPAQRTERTTLGREAA